MSQDGFLDIDHLVPLFEQAGDNVAALKPLLLQLANLPAADEADPGDDGWAATRYQVGGETNLAVWQNGEDGRLIVATLRAGQVESLYSSGRLAGIYADQTPDGEVIIDADSDRQWGAGRQAQLRRLQTAAQNALRELRATPAGIDWLCPSCGWPNDAAATLCSECHTPNVVADINRAAAPAAPPGDSLFADLIRHAGSELADEVADFVVEKVAAAPETTRCVRCEKEIEPDARFCRHCGAEQPHHCDSCGRPLKHDSRFCAHCGAKQKQPK